MDKISESELRHLVPPTQWFYGAFTAYEMGPEGPIPVTVWDRVTLPEPEDESLAPEGRLK